MITRLFGWLGLLQFAAGCTNDRVPSAVESTPQASQSAAPTSSSVPKAPPTRERAQALTLEGLSVGFERPSFSPDGVMVAAATGGGMVTLWNALDGSQIWTVPCGGLAGPVAFSPDGRTIATGHHDNSLAIRNLETGAVVHELLGHQEDVVAVAFSSDGSRLASAAWYDAIRVWDTVSGAALATHATIRGTWTQVTWFPDGKRLLMAPAMIVDAESGKVLLRFGNGVLDAVELSADGSTLATSTSGMGLWERGARIPPSGDFLWNTSDGTRVTKLPNSDVQQAESIAFASKADRLAVLRKGKAITVSTISGQEVVSLPVKFMNVQGIAMAADGSAVFGAGSVSNELKVWTWIVDR